MVGWQVIRRRDNFLAFLFLPRFTRRTNQFSQASTCSAWARLSDCMPELVPLSSSNHAPQDHCLLSAYDGVKLAKNTLLSLPCRWDLCSCILTSWSHLQKVSILPFNLGSCSNPTFTAYVILVSMLISLFFVQHVNLHVHLYDEVIYLISIWHLGCLRCALFTGSLHMCLGRL